MGRFDESIHMARVQLANIRGPLLSPLIRMNGSWIDRLATSILLASLLVLPTLVRASLSPLPNEGQVWQVLEMRFDLDRPSSDPAQAEFRVEFRGPDGKARVIPGFRNGPNAWMLRFTPSIPGQWHYRVLSTPDGSSANTQLSRGNIAINPPDPDETNPLRRHGGHLKVGPDGRYLTYGDGTPFFWLADTWWFCPSHLCPIEGSSRPGGDSMFRLLVDTRARQGYTVAQIAFAGLAKKRLFRPREWSEREFSYWREVDKYIEYANERGLLLAMGFGFHRALDDVPLEDLKLLWSHLVARYGAHAVTWFIVGEYNLDNPASRIEKVMALGRHIRQIDPVARAMSVHPWVYDQERRQAWSEPWYDFIMLQGSHNEIPKPEFYRSIYQKQPAKPLIESESIFEGIKGKGAGEVRKAAYRAIQSGAIGYSYGAHGLWYPTQDAQDQRFAEYGKPIPWWEALALPGGQQMGHMKKLYQSVDWWRLQPRPDAVVSLTRKLNSDILVKADRTDTYVVYFSAGMPPSDRALLKGTDSTATYTCIWFDPRRGEFITAPSRPERDSRFLFLPTRPSEGDWILLLKKNGPT